MLNAYFEQDVLCVVMSVCYHPTTVFVVDDDVNFLDTLKASVPGI